MADIDSAAGIQPVVSSNAAHNEPPEVTSPVPHVPSTSGRGVVGKKANVAAVIVAGGSGERFGRHGGKQLLPICGKPLMSWCLQAFDAVSCVGKIVIVCPEARCEEYRSLAVEPYGLVTPVEFVPSGSIRQESALHGVEAVAQDLSLIHI